MIFRSEHSLPGENYFEIDKIEINHFISADMF